MSTSLVVTPLQNDIIIGTMLGDASAERSKGYKNTRLRYEQSYPAHAGYLMSLYNSLKSLTMSEPKVVLRRPDKRTGLVYPSISFKTRSLPVLNAYRELFYLNGTKIVPFNIQELLSPVALAY
jgi:hypothetical protein